MPQSHLLIASRYSIALALLAAAGTGHAQAAGAQKQAPQITEAEAEAQRAYEVALAKAEAQRNYDIAVAAAEAERRKAIALARGAQSADQVGSTGPAPRVERAGPAPADGAPRPTSTLGGQTQVANTPPEECDAQQRTAQGIVRRPNVYAHSCLNLRKWSDYAVPALNTTLSIGSANDVAELIGSFSLYRREPVGAGGDSYSFTRWQARGGALIPVDKAGGTTAAFADLSKVDPFKRVGWLLGLEWRSGAEAKTSDLNAKVHTMLAKAQRDCVDAANAQNLIGDGQAVGTGGVPANCRAEQLHVWMAGDKTRANTYWAMVVDDLWGKKPKTELFFGLEGRIVPYQLEYLPLKDDGLTGDTLITGSPFDGTGTLIKANFREFDRPRYSVKLYGGGVAGDLGWGGSLTYRRVVDQPKGTKDVVLCPPSTANGVTCGTQQIARPYESEGFVVGARVSGKIQRILFLPEAGIEMKVSYATDLNQIGFDAPLYLLADKDGKATGGLRLGCTGDGTTSAGYKIKGECKASVFIGTSFALRGAP